ncbi:Zn(II)2Cys6 transcription factor domain-containing protein [Aspergillus stella-maris]|uniref:Zn(II)2Cys6 transcription factor domain-containing protein n=1 Tax=Aspergillus stella-maris TaxID=1810926 RepID=UPI003CCE4386
MVRHGRLSKGCQTCRKRKIKCDQALPSCSQCRKAGWVCPQYGDSVDRMFQYQHTNLKTEIKQPGPTIKGLRTAKATSAMSFELDRTRLAFSVPSCISQPLNDRAVEYFLITNTFRNDDKLRGFYEYLPSFNDTQSGEEVSLSLTAAALAAYANRFGHPEVLDRARHYYGRSLQSVNRALQSPVDAATDDTMISILLLNTFEGLTSESPTSMAYSEGHMKGELMVLNLRGESVMKTRHGLQIFQHMSRCIITYCVIRPTRVPPDVIRLRRLAAKYMDTSDPAWMVEEMMIKLASFHTDVSDGVLANPQSIINVALELDEELCMLKASLLPISRPKPTQSADTIESQAAAYMYPDLWTVYIWNYVRTCRLRLQNEVVVQLSQQCGNLPSPSTEDEGLLLQSCATMEALILEICASVRQYGGYLLADSRNQYATRQVAGPVPMVAGVYFLLWPLLIAGSMTASDTQRDWIVQQCRLLAKLTGIQRMATVADAIANGDEPLL